MNLFQRRPGPDLKGPPVFNAPPVILWVCGVILVCSVIFFLLSPELQYRAFRHLAIIPDLFLMQFQGDDVQPSLAGLLPLVTHALLHADFMHLLLNLGFLLAFGTVVERSCGGLQMLIIFVMSAIVGATVQVWSMGLVQIPVIGASGGVYGLMGATMSLMIREKIEARLRRVVHVIVIMMLLNLFFAVTGVFDMLSGTQVAWAAHFGGFAAGALLGAFGGKSQRLDKEA